MTALDELHALGQSIWLDNITRGLLDSGQLQRDIDTRRVTGLTSNPSIFDHAIATGDYDESISASTGRTNEDVFFELAIADLRRAADLLRPVFERTDGVDGWVSLEVSPVLAHDTASTIAEATGLHRRADRPNLLVKIPGTREGLPAIEECIASGVPINVTLLFDAAQYRAAADAYLRGIERRVAAGLNPAVGCVASVFVSRWDVAVAKVVPAELRNRLGLAVGREAYRAYRDVVDSVRFQALANAGARVQRLLWASTKTKDPAAPDTLYVHGLAAPLTINTMPDATLEAFADHGAVGEPLGRDGDDADLLARYGAAGVDRSALALSLQREGADAFVASWNDLLARIGAQRGAPTGAG
jgi:transaldolase